MKTDTDFLKSISQLSTTQLNEKLEELRGQLFALRLNARTSHVRDNSQFKKIRKNIARVLTRISQENS